MNYCHPWKLWNALWASSQLDAIVHLSIRSDKLLFRPIRNLVSDLKSNFLMEKTVTTVIFRKMTSTGVFHPTLPFPFEVDEGREEGGEVRWFTSWKVSRENQEYYRFLQDGGHELSWAAWNISRQVSRTLVVRP